MQDGKLITYLKKYSPNRFNNEYFKKNVQIAVVHWHVLQGYNFGEAPIETSNFFPEKHFNFVIIDLNNYLQDPIKWLPVMLKTNEYSYPEKIDNIWSFVRCEMSEDKWNEAKKLLQGNAEHAIPYLNNDDQQFQILAEFKLFCKHKKILFLTIQAFMKRMRSMPDKYRTDLSVNRKAKKRNDKYLNEMFKTHANFCIKQAHEKRYKEGKRRDELFQIYRSSRG